MSVEEKGIRPEECRSRNFRFMSNTGKLIALSILVLAIACAEFPELARLIDNPDNDFTVPNYVIHDANLPAVSERVPSTAGLSSEPASFKPAAFLNGSAIFRTSGDLLLLYSILRT